MAAKHMNIEMRRGDTPVVVAFLKDENGAPVNDVTAQYKLQARVTRAAVDPAVFTVGPLAQFAAGEGRLPIPANATSGFTDDRVLYYDVQVVETNGNVTTLLEGTLTVLADVAR